MSNLSVKRNAFDSELRAFADGMHRADSILQLHDSGRHSLHQSATESWIRKLDNIARSVKNMPGIKPKSKPTIAAQITKEIDKAATYADTDVEAARIACFATALIVSHSSMENVIIATLKSVSVAHPERLMSLLKARKISVDVAYFGGIQEIINEVRQQWLREVERESLIRKISWLYDLEAVGLVRETLGNEQATQVIKKLDTWRHEATHASTTAFASCDVAGLIESVYKLGLQILAILNYYDE